MRRPPSRTDLMALMVLALLSEQPRHPYDLQRLIRERHKDFADGKPRSLYHAVDHLAGKGFIELVETSREGKRPERTIYRMTDDGREEFTQRLADLLETPQAEHPVFEAAISFLAYLPPERALDVLSARLVGLESGAAALEACLRGLRVQLHLPRLFILEVEYSRVLCQAELEWVRSLIEDIRSGRLAWSPGGPSGGFRWPDQEFVAEETA
ncbi:MAG: PadR family transcriptional regulator [Chloroflexota bacterium]